MGPWARTKRVRKYRESAHGPCQLNRWRSIVTKRRGAESTGPRAASAAATTLSSPTAGKAAKSAAGSALTQVHSKEVTGPKAATAAARTLSNARASPAAKSAAGSALTQRPGRGKR